jgi:hypothetical protein
MPVAAVSAPSAAAPIEQLVITDDDVQIDVAIPSPTKSVPVKRKGRPAKSVAKAPRKSKSLPGDLGLPQQRTSSATGAAVAASGKSTAEATTAAPLSAAAEAEMREYGLVCPITDDVFEDPVVASDGHTYEARSTTLSALLCALISGTAAVRPRHVAGEERHFAHHERTSEEGADPKPNAQKPG